MVWITNFSLRFPNSSPNFHIPLPFWHIQASSGKRKAVKQQQVSKEVYCLESDFLFSHNQQDPRIFSNEFSRGYLDSQACAMIFLKDLQNMHRFSPNLQWFSGLFCIFKGIQEIDLIHFIIIKLFIGSSIGQSFRSFYFNCLLQFKNFLSLYHWI